jgi:DNA invertase Pin-like site-specific DNA recombinase
MRVVSYSRVSTIGQETEGQSLVNQERGFKRWLEKTGHERVRAYAETASAKSVAGRAVFSKMIGELEDIKPDAIIVDTLDRFTRNLREGLNLLEELRGHKIGLLPLDWRRNTPLDIDDDRDWEDVAREFMAAERERRRIGGRVQRHYDELREQGKSIVGRHVPFGLNYVDGHFAPNDQAEIVKEIDRRFIEGEPIEQLLAYSRSIGAWQARTGFTNMLRSLHYVKAGVRSPETQQAILERLELFREQYGKMSKYDHEFTGVFLCGKCVNLGYPAETSKMSGREMKGYIAVACDRRTLADRRHGQFVAGIDNDQGGLSIREQWKAYLDIVADPKVIDRWGRAEDSSDEKRIRLLHRNLAQIDQEAAKLKERRDAALDLFTSLRGVAKGEVEQSLTEIGADQSALRARKEAILGELAATPSKKRDPGKLGAAINYRADYEHFSLRERNEWNRALCAMLGSHPIVNRVGDRRGFSPLVVSWPQVDVLRSRRRVIVSE